METIGSIPKTACPNTVAWCLRTACVARLLPLLLLLSLPAVVQAQFTFTTNNGAITITGYTGSGGVVVIPSATNGYPVTSIGNSAFVNCINLTSVTIPDSVTNIGSVFPPGGAFHGCINLTSVTMGNGVTSIGGGAFSHCSSLTNITIPNSVTSIGGNAFSYCSSLTSVSIPNSAINIGQYSFNWCTSLTNVTIGNSVTSIGDYTFYSCTNLTAITVDESNSVYSSEDGVLFDKSQTTLIQYPGGKADSYTVPNSVISIGHWAFSGCTSLTNVTIPNSVTSIRYWAFSYCTSLISVTIPNSVTNIEFDVFSHCTSLTNVTIGNSVTSIGDWAFDFCASLTAITVDTNNPAYSSLAGVLFNKSQTTLIAYPGDYAGSYTVPNSVTSFGVGVFADCTSLTNVTIGNSVTNIGGYAFLQCSSLTSVYFQGNAPSLGSAVFYGDNNATVYYLPGTTNWGTTFGGLPTVLWNPQAQTSDASFGVRTNQFGFNITGTTNIPIVIEACADLASPVWVPLQSCTLSNGSVYFSDPKWTNYPGRFYRLRSP